MAILLNKPIFQERVKDATDNKMAFWAGFMYGLFRDKPYLKSSKNKDKSMYDIMERVYMQAHETYGQLNNQARSFIKRELDSEGIGITEDGIKYLWDGFIEAAEIE